MAKAGVEVVGVDKVKAAIRLKSVAARSGGVSKLVVGYSADYALHVHENMDVHHDSPTKAKFLTGPERRIRKQMSAMVKAGLKAGKTPRAALWPAGQLLVKASLAECPIDTGKLRQSVYIAVIKG